MSDSGKDVVFFNYGTINAGKTFSTIGTPSEPGVLRCVFGMIRSEVELHAF